MASTPTTNLANGATKVLEEAHQKHKEGDFAKSLELFDQALGLDSTLINALVGKSKLLIDMSKPEQALIWMQAALALEDSTSLLVETCKIYLRLNLTPEASQGLQDVLNRDPKNYFAGSLYSLTLNQMEDSEEALKQAEKVLSEDAENVMANGAKAVALAHLNKTDESISLFKEKVLDKVSVNDINDEVSYGMGFGLAATHPELALQHLNIGLSKNPRNLSVLLFKSELLMNLGLEAEATACLETVDTMTSEMGFGELLAPDEVLAGLLV